MLADSFFCFSLFLNTIALHTKPRTQQHSFSPLPCSFSPAVRLFTCLTVWAVDVPCQQRLSSPISFDACLTSILNKGTARHAFRSPVFQPNPSLFLTRSRLRLLIVFLHTASFASSSLPIYVHCTLFVAHHSFPPHRYEHSLYAPNKDRRRTEHARQQNFKHIHLYHQTPLDRTTTPLFRGNEHVSRKQNTMGGNCISPEAGLLLFPPILTSNAN